LQSLNLSFTLVTDESLKKIANLSSLKSVNIDNHQITDIGLAALTSMCSHMILLFFYQNTVGEAPDSRNIIPPFFNCCC
jgi:hypothetical protein